jgi:hypothetical protein
MLAASPSHSSSTSKTRMSSVLAVSTHEDTFEVLISRLHESHAVSAYEAIERLVEAGQAVGFDIDDLVRLLDRGKSLQEVFELVESKMQEARNAA